MRILLIEDDEVLANILLQSLSKQHYVAELATDGQTGKEYALSTSYDLILMDVGLPKLDGISLCQQLRNSGCSTPILLMTAKDASSDRIRGLDAGADDYVIKPLDLGELRARIRALLRRADNLRTPILEVAALRLDPSSCQVTYEGKALELTPKEYSLLELFMRNPSRVFSRGNIIEHLWTFDDPPQEESVKSHIKGLRQKLKAAGAVDWIENVYGVGYRLNPTAGANKEKDGKGKKKEKQAREEKQESLSLSSVITSESIEEQFSQAMTGLWQQYRELMMQRLEVLQQAGATLTTGKLTTELHQAAEQQAHKLAGVLGMFEQEIGTQLAREIEQILAENKDLLPDQQQLLPSLINKLADIINNTDQKYALASGSSHVSFAQSPDARLLLVDPDPQLGTNLQQLAQSRECSWQQVTRLAEAQSWLQTTSPDLVVLSVDEVGPREESLALLSDLVKRSPPIPVIALAAVDGLVDRVTVARLGARGFLVKPVTATQVWDVGYPLLQRNRSLTVNVLVVDDDPLILAALRSLLEPWGIRMTGLEHPLCFWEVLQTVAPDLLILDVEMPELNGIELCQAVRTDPHWQGLPILFLTAHRDAQTVQQVFLAGADDYVIKPVVEAELLTRIINRLERSRLLQSFSTKELITGLANQPQSYRDLQFLINQAQVHGQPVCFTLLWITELPQINAQYGHDAGNLVLQRWSHFLQSAFRGGEVLGYWGNGEFVVGFLGLTKTEVSDRLHDLLTTLRQQIFTTVQGDRYQAICHLAIAEYPSDGTTIQALYQVTSSSRDRTRTI